MADTLKVAIIHKGEDLPVFNDLLPCGLPWQLEFIEQSSLRACPTSMRRDFLAVIFPHEIPDMPRTLAMAFPGARFLAYARIQPGIEPACPYREDRIPVFALPGSAGILHHMLETYALTRTSRFEISLVRERADRLQDILGSYVDVIESAWDASERKLGVILLINKVLSLLQAEECVIYLLGDAGTGLHRAFSTGNIKDIDLFDHHANSSIVGGVLSSGAPYVNNSYSFETKVPGTQESVLVKSVLCVPLQRKGSRFGAIELLNKQEAGGFTSEDLSLMQMLAEPLAVAIRTIHLFEESERLTITDDLTKLFNYRYLMEYLEGEVKRCLRYKKKVSLLFIDVDGFKRINDTFGHMVGSQALAEMGQVFRRILRETDVVGRYGGDEFVIVLPETPLNGAMVIAERIRKRVEDYEFVAQNVTIRLTVSLGVANCPKHTLTAEGLIKKADAAMYRAKELSKNSIRVAV